jgi:hypothetical protein
MENPKLKARDNFKGLNSTNPEAELFHEMWSETPIRLPWKQSTFQRRQTDHVKVTGS